VIANARMYAVSSAAAQCWRNLFEALAERAGLELPVVDHPAPAPMAGLWSRQDLGAVFMCGLPFSRAVPAPVLLAAPVPSPDDFADRPQYWSEFVVRTDSRHARLSDTFGLRIAFTTPESQSGFAAPLRFLSQLGGNAPLYTEVIAPTITPRAALQAVAEDDADVAPIDSYALALLRRFEPELAGRVRTLSRTAARPIPPLVASAPPPPALRAALLSAHEDARLRALLEPLLLRRFQSLPADSYQRLASEYRSTLQAWQERPLALRLHPAFASVLHRPLADVR
jgi:ABC-type phosphate/phosphonate transport system substrate-binding protein